MVKERYKNDCLSIEDAGAKIKQLINNHLLDLGINPKIPPIELLSDDFIAHVNKHAQGDPQSKASEMEHAIRKHCTVKFEEDPAFYKRMSEKLERLIQEHGNNWRQLVMQYEKLTDEIRAGRREGIPGVKPEAVSFYEYVRDLAYAKGAIPPGEVDAYKRIINHIVEALQATIGIVDFWNKKLEIKRLRGTIENELLLSGIPALESKHERIAWFAPKVGVRTRRWQVRELGHRWAGCTPLGELTFHWKCMMAPLSVIDYIVVHELCHFHHSDHSEAFWNEVDKILPDYRERKDWLRKNGAGLTL
ncbi:MAG: M48 family metallopeptidase [Opitutales bacterium]|nr:M48 family metallopeptidase [Opitutales bacterium]